MDDFRVEYYIDSGDGQKIKMSSLNGIDMKQWKKDVEARALSEYYKQKIKISSKKI